jgi:prepilin-type N-terminal cleavage/methylation domain-containing protein
MNKKTKRGFTIVELVIVIAVIAILAAVLIPTFASVIEKANLSSDQQAVRNMNTVLATMTDDNLEYNDIAEELDEAGYNVSNKNNAWNPVSKGTSAYWIAEKNTIVLVKETKIIFPENLAGDFDATKATALKANNYVLTSTSTTAKDVASDIKTAINNGNSITLTVQVDLTEMKAIQVPEDANLTVDLGGSTLATDERNPGLDHQYGFQVSGNLTIENAKIAARGVEVYDGGTLILGEGVEIDAVDTNGGAAVYVWKGGKAIINGGTYYNSVAGGTELEGATAVISYGDITINGGTFNSSAGGYAIIIRGGKAIINDATITGARGGIAVENAEATINNCTVTSNWTTNTSCYALYIYKSNVTINGGTFTTVNGADPICEDVGANVTKTNNPVENK